MITRYISNLHKIPAIVALFVAALIGSATFDARAFSPDTYASESRLADGNWVKISVEQTGMHFIPAATLRQWGFSDIQTVNIYGYGGNRLPDILNDYIDDLPTVQCLKTQAGIYFYALGPTTVRRRDIYLSPQHNPFSTLGYYYLSDRSAEPRAIDTTDLTAAGNNDTPVSVYGTMVYHEVDAVSPGEVGHLLVGEDFRYTRTQSFNLDTPGRVEGTPVCLEASFVASVQSPGSWLSYSLNGQALPRESSSDDTVTPVTDAYTYGYETVSRKECMPTGTRMNVGVTFNSSGTVNMANLNYLALSYVRSLALNNGVLDFTVYDNNAYRLAGATKATHIWDVTDPLDICAVKGVDKSGAVEWYADQKITRTYAAFNEGATLPAPKLAGRVANQNIHGMETPDMIIVTVEDWSAEAERLAEFHRQSDDHLKVLVIPHSIIYNEFSSGAPDVNGIRKMFKMFYDRPGDDGTRLRYVLLMGRATSDNRRLTTQGKALSYTPLPTWVSDSGLNQNASYTTDDIFAFLEDNSGRSFSSDKLSVAVGRLPVKSATEAANAVNKIIRYSTTPRTGDWRNHVLMVADDEDYAIHMKQAEQMAKNMLASDGGADMYYQKLYIDQYERSNGTYPEARTALFRSLDDGIIWWNYNGHANPTAWTHDGLMTYTDIGNLYLRYEPFVYAATCDFMRWDCAQVSGAEILFLNDGSGTIGTISATRPVYISDNGVFSQSVGRYAFARREDGRRHTIGEIMQMAKNNYRVGNEIVSNSNKLRYVLLGDPAMYLAIPDAGVVVESVNGMTPDDEDPIVINARQQVKVSGHVTAPDGTPLTDYNGTLSYTMYDAEMSTTTLGNGDKGDPLTFDQQGSRLVSGRSQVIDGRFEINISMPAEISDNYRPAALNIFVDGGSPERTAITHFRDFYVYDTDWSAAEDNVAPLIESMYLNNEAFGEGDIVNTSPMLFATISDDKALNMSQAGVGHQMLLTLDGDRSYTDVSNFFTPADDGSPKGIIAYPLEDLTEGMHTLRLRVWDTSANSVTKTIEFGVSAKKEPILYDIYTDASPATDRANFYLVHDRPDKSIRVTITVYNLLGKPVWSSTTTQRSEAFSTTPVTWDLCDDAGRRVPRGIYLYRASITESSGDIESNTATKRIAVSGQ